MKDDFLRPPRSIAEWTADALRAVGILGVVAAAVWLVPTDAGILALALPALMLPRMLGLRPWFDVVACATVLVAVWSNVLELYTSIRHWDLLLHFACTAALSIVGAVILSRTGVAPITGVGTSARVPMVLLPTIALAISAAWEMIEWLGLAYLSDDIFVTYQDTIGDMAFGGLGGLAAGALLAVARVERVDRCEAPAAPDKISAA